MKARSSRPPTEAPGLAPEEARARGAVCPGPLVIADGTLEAMKWLGMVLMVLDHANKYLLGGAVALLYDLGRLAMPLFGFVLMFNLARPGAFATGAHVRVMKRLAAFGGLATPAFVALVGWWPLNILFMLLLATAMVWLAERGGMPRLILAATVFVLGGAWVEFWWFGILCCLGAWAYCKQPTPTRLILWTVALAALWVVNRNFSALAMPVLLWGATQVAVPTKRSRWLFYFLYPAHLTAIAILLALG